MAGWWALGRGTLRRDLALAAISLAGGLAMYVVGYRQITPYLRVPPALFLVTLGVVCLALALRRVATRTSLVVGSLAIIADMVLGGSLATILIFTQVLYDACVYGPVGMWRWLLRISVVLTGLAAVTGLLVFGSWRGMIGVAVPVALIAVLPVVTGISVRQYRDQAAAERARAEQTARLAELDRRQAVTAERTRMARELHDVVANHLSAVAIHATAALSVRDLDRAQLDQALRVIRENSVQGLAEMRQMIGLLRDPAAADRDRQPGSADPANHRDGGGTAPAGDGSGVEELTRVRLAEVDRLVAQAREAGLSVCVETTGEARPLPVNVDLAAYRIVQESLTNALKHGSGEAALTVSYGAGLVSVTVENPLADRDAAGRDPAAGGAGAGHRRLPGAGAGLIGMRERATLLRGRIHAGPLGDRWRVHAELPVTEETP